jgi:integrase
LPIETADRLTRHLTEADVETLREVFRAATSENSIRALASDLGYLEAWSRAVTGEPLSWPPSEEDALRFIAHHLFLPDHDGGGAGKGMPRQAEEQLRADSILKGQLPHAPDTVRRRLSSWRRAAQARGFEEALLGSIIRRTIAAATKASTKPKERKAKTPIVRELLDRMIGEEGDLPTGQLSLRELRDRTLLIVAFASGGRRRSEMGDLLIENAFELEGGKGYGIHLGRTKTTTAQDGQYLIVRGRAAAYLKAWLAALDERLADEQKRDGRARGAIFRRIDRHGGLGDHGITGAGVNMILKRKAKEAGMDAQEVSAHGLRSGYLTECSKRGIPLEAAMRHSRHRSVQSANRYYDDQSAEDGEAANVGG